MLPLLVDVGLKPNHVNLGILVAFIFYILFLASRLAISLVNLFVVVLARLALC